MPAQSCRSDRALGLWPAEKARKIALASLGGYAERLGLLDVAGELNPCRSLFAAIEGHVRSHARGQQGGNIEDEIQGREQQEARPKAPGQAQGLGESAGGCRHRGAIPVSAMREHAPRRILREDRAGVSGPPQRPALHAYRPAPNEVPGLRTAAGGSRIRESPGRLTAEHAAPTAEVKPSVE